MPTEIQFAGGGTVKVTAELSDVADALSGGAPILLTSRFAGFRGELAVAGESVVVRVGAIACALEIASP
jgi:hypothetical protein